MRAVLAHVARSLARSQGLPLEQEEVLLFSLQLLSNQVLGLLAIALAGALAGVLGPTLMATLVAGSLKLFAGGPHMSTSLRCGVFSTVIAVAMGWLAARTAPAVTPGAAAALLAAALLAAAASFWRYTPADTPENPVTDPRRRRRLRRTAFTLLGLWGTGLLFWQGLHGTEALPFTLAGTLGLAWQSLSVTPAGYRLVAIGDGLRLK